MGFSLFMPLMMVFKSTMQMRMECVSLELVAMASRLWDANQYGVHVTSAGGHSMNIQGEKTSSTLAGHIGLIKNRSTGSSPDVLALQVGNTNPGVGCNFLTFYDGTGNILGEVQGNESGGVSFVSHGSDYAEYLPVLDREEHFEAGDVVGIYSGHISKLTRNADNVMVISGEAAIIGNRPDSSGAGSETIRNHEVVSFVGQVRTKVEGVVHPGYWIAASGNNDGTAVAIPPEDIKAHHQILGQAWERSANPGVKRIRTAVGLDRGQVWAKLIGSQQAELNSLHQMIREMREEIARSNRELNNTN